MEAAHFSGSSGASQAVRRFLLRGRVPRMVLTPGLVLPGGVRWALLCGDAVLGELWRKKDRTKAFVNANL